MVTLPRSLAPRTVVTLVSSPARKSSTRSPVVGAMATLAASLLGMFAVDEYDDREDERALVEHSNKLTERINSLSLVRKVEPREDFHDVLPRFEFATVPTSAEPSPIYMGAPVNTAPEYPITILDKKYFVIGYSEDLKNPAWVCYRIGAAVDFGSYRRPGFRTDSDTQARVTSDDYTNTGFDRGHMAPNFAIASRFGGEGAKKTFVMSNVCPQYHTFNDGQWGDLEEWIAGRKLPNNGGFIRGWADEYGEVWVVVGPLFVDERAPTSAGIPVPSAYFCIVLDENEHDPRALAFVMEHEDERVDELGQFLRTVDEVEDLAGLDFFPDLQESVERELESSAQTTLWPLPVAPN